MDTAKTGRRIKAFRKLKGYTQINLAKALHVSISELRAVERGVKETPDILLDQISSLLSVSREELIGQTEIKDVK
ncbi:helix-turn-helix domain-containing protein [Virgibacillus sp. DJP39]|uniref:helix-turn-helix domain-containing protein n=1 Tax=Virgibacillus sp. DJP39 TaxID=3409790 RepID=UPI003BB62B10